MLREGRGHATDRQMNCCTSSSVKFSAPRTNCSASNSAAASGSTLAAGMVEREMTRPAKHRTHFGHRGPFLLVPAAEFLGGHLAGKKFRQSRLGSTGRYWVIWVRRFWAVPAVSSTANAIRAVGGLWTVLPKSAIVAVLPSTKVKRAPASSRTPILRCKGATSSRQCFCKVGVLASAFCRESSMARRSDRQLLFVCVMAQGIESLAHFPGKFGIVGIFGQAQGCGQKVRGPTLAHGAVGVFPTGL